jgi:exodeoxyribonuclease VII small subunit
MKSKSKLSLESTIESLVNLVEKLENEETSLEDALASFEAGIILTRKAQNALSAVEQRVRSLTENGADITESNFLPGEEDG